MFQNPFLPDPAESFMKSTMAEFEKIIEKGVLGEAMTVGDYTMIPIQITTLGVGAGGGTTLGEMCGGGGGGGLIPCAIIIVGPDGVEIKELRKETVTSAAKAHGRMVSDQTAQFSKSSYKPMPVSPAMEEPDEPVPTTQQVLPPSEETPA